MSESIYDLAREAEHLKSNLQHLQESSSPPDTSACTWSTRQRLEELYRQMLLLDLDTALESGVEVDLWNCVFRTEITSLQTSLTQQFTKREEVLAVFYLFLETTSAFYYQLIQSICYRYNSPLPTFLSPEDIGVCRRALGASTAGEDSVRMIAQDCLMRMGDVARYKGECALANKYYLQADELLPGKGIISNQLGLIATIQGNFYKAAFHYSHSIISSSPFSPSRNNLEQLFQSYARQFPDDISNIPSFQIGLLYLISLIYFSRDLDFFTLLLSKLTAVLSSLLQLEGDEREFVLCTVGLCLFACVVSYQPITGIKLDKVSNSLTAEEIQKCKLSLFLLFETTQVLISSSLSTTHSLLNSVLPFLATILRWLTLHTHHTSAHQLTQVPSLWQSIAQLFNSLCVKSGSEAGIDLSQTLSEELALIEFISYKHNHNVANTCAKDTLCIAKLISHLKCLIRCEQCDFLSLRTHNGIYKLVYTAPVIPVNSATSDHHVITSPTLSPLFASPMLNNSSECSFFPGIWSDTLYQQDSPLLVDPSVDTIQSLWNSSDPTSP